MSSLQRIFPFNNSLVRRFLNWKQGDEEDTWRNKAVEALVKKLRQTNQYENLELVLYLKCEASPCITLSRSQDGRLQVSHRKMLPHVMSCRIFRWPDVLSQHELRSMPACKFPAGRRDQNMVCVNPYHYSRVDHSTYPPVVAPRNNGTEFVDTTPPPQSPMSPGYGSETHWYPGPNGEPIMGLAEQATPLAINYQNSPLANYNSPMPSQSSPLPSYSSRDPQSLALTPMDTEDARSFTQSYAGSVADEDYWCRITYAELNQKVGEPFRSSYPEVIVDGFTDPSVRNRRFSLGVLSNINRNSTIELTRRAIRKGIRLENNDQQIHVKNLSESSIFFHSKNCNIENQLNQHAVVKIEPNKRQKIFDYKVFENLLQEATEDGTFERLYNLIEHCIIKLSFVKGWGSIYQRQDVTSTPCWIEIHLLKPYAMMDEYLRRSGAPKSKITSTS